MEKLRRKVELAIEKQLKEKQIYCHAHYQDLARDYMEFFDIKTMLQADIKERGVSVKWNNGGGQEGYKKNDSVTELIKVNKQMLTILYDLGIRPADLKVTEDEEEL